MIEFLPGPGAARLLRTDEAREVLDGHLTIGRIVAAFDLLLLDAS